MKKYSVKLKRNNKFLVAYLCIILLLPSLLQSCLSEKELESSASGSVDVNSLTYLYQTSSNSGGNIRKSPSGNEVGFNVALFLLSGLEGKKRPSSGTFNDTKFQSSMPLYASSIQEHGPFYSGVQNSEVNITKQDKSAPSANSEEHIRFMGGIEFIQKGAKDGGTKTHLYYLEVPLYITYWTNISAKGKIFGGLGPYIAYGIAGNVKSQTSKVKAFDKNGDFKPFDAGLTLTGGYKIPNSFSFRLAYDLGIANILRNAGSNNAKAKSRTISLNIGYPLNKIFKGK